ncbi:MAG: flagellar hook-basal body complex protein FliE [Proteobacteria bacterium]|nr:flagellar hook-basal body complex protein FliE [Pseudomonadota bacterium]
MSDADLRIGSGENMQLASKTPALAPKSEGPGFAEVLGGVLRSANRDQLAAHKTAADLARGKVGTLDAILAIQKADESLRFVLRLRNTALEAYRKIIRAGG